MARSKSLEGFDCKMNLRFPDDLVGLIILKARKARQPESLIVADALRSYWGLDQAPEEGKPKEKKANQAEKGKIKTEKPKRPGPRPAPPSTEKQEMDAEGYPFTWDRLSEALATCSGGKKYGLQRELAQHLGLSNLSVWAKSGVPRKWWPALRTFLQSRGWVPPQEQQSIFS